MLAFIKLFKESLRFYRFRFGGWCYGDRYLSMWLYAWRANCSISSGKEFDSKTISFLLDLVSIKEIFMVYVEVMVQFP